MGTHVEARCTRRRVGERIEAETNFDAVQSLELFGLGSQCQVSQTHETRSTEFHSIGRDADAHSTADLEARNKVCGYEAPPQELGAGRPLGFNALDIGSFDERSPKHGPISAAHPTERQWIDTADCHAISTNRSTEEPAGQCDSTAIEEMISHLAGQIWQNPSNFDQAALANSTLKVTLQ